MKLVKINNEYYLLDGEIKDGDKVLHEGDILTVNKNKGAYLSTYQFPHIDIKADVCDKIIGSSTFISTDITLLNKNEIEKLLNDDDVEKLAMDKLKDKWSHLYQFGYPKRPFPTNYQNDLNCVMLGILQKQNSDKKFTLDDMRKCFEASRETIKHPDWDNIYDNFEHYMKSKSEEKKEWSVEIETEILCTNCGQENCDRLQCRGSKDIPYPKITNGYIIITKIKQ